MSEPAMGPAPFWSVKMVKKLQPNKPKVAPRTAAEMEWFRLRHLSPFWGVGLRAALDVPWS